MSSSCRRYLVLSNVPVEMYWYAKGVNIGNTKPQWTMEVANISPTISTKFEHDIWLLYIEDFLKPFPAIKPNTILGHKGNTRENYCLSKSET